MSAPTTSPARRADPAVFTERLNLVWRTRNLRPATDREHADDIRAAGGDTTITRQLKPRTKQEIALAIRKTPSYVSQLMEGKATNPTLDTLWDLAVYFGEKVGYLAGDPDHDHDLELRRDAARETVHNDRSLRTMADRLNGLIAAIRPGGGDTEYTDLELAEIAGCTVEQIQALRAGGSPDITLPALRRLCGGLGVSLGYLVDGVDADRVDERVATAHDLVDDGTLLMALQVAQHRNPDQVLTLADMISSLMRVQGTTAGAA